MDVRKTIYGLIRDFENHLFLLNVSLKNHQSHPAFFILMASQLRTLLCKGKDHEDLLLLLARIINFKTTISFDQPKVKISFNQYLHEKNIFILGKEYSRIHFIKIMANNSGDFLHIKKTTDERVAIGNRINLFGINPNNRMLLNIAETTLSVSLSLMEKLNNMPQEKLQEINDIFLKNK